MTSDTSLTITETSQRGPRALGYAAAAHATVWALEAKDRLKARLSDEHGGISAIGGDGAVAAAGIGIALFTISPLKQEAVNVFKALFSQVSGSPSAGFEG